MITLTITHNIIEICLLIMSLGLIIASYEDYKCSHLFDTHGILSFEILKYANPNTLHGRFWKIIGWFQTPLVFRSVFIVRMVLALLMTIAITTGIAVPVILFPMTLFLFLTHILISLRSLYGLDGAHQMNLILLLASTLYFLATPNSFTQEFCILFIGAQATMSYVVSGIYKWMGKQWRNGSALSGIMSARIYGHPWLGGLLRSRPLTSKFMCWAVIGFEATFLIIIFAPPIVVYIYLCCGVVFHMLNAIFMGLNGFFFSFVATYPPVIYLNHYIRSVCFL